MYGTACSMQTPPPPPVKNFLVRLTSAGHEYLDGHRLEQVATAENRPDLVEVPFPMDVVHVWQNLKGFKRDQG